VEKGNNVGVLHLVVGAVEDQDQSRAGYDDQLGNDGSDPERAHHVHLFGEGVRRTGKWSKACVHRSVDRQVLPHLNQSKNVMRHLSGREKKKL